MNIPSTRELLNRFIKIEESEKIKSKSLLESDESGDTFGNGAEQKITSKDNHSGKVRNERSQGSENSQQSYDGNDKEVDTKTGNERGEGSEKAEQEYTGNDKPVSDNFKFSKGGDKSVAAAKGADKEFSNYRSKIRAAMRGGIATPIDKPEFKGNQGLNK